MAKIFYLFLILSPNLLRVAADINSGECRSALGMEEGRIPDHAITASSSYEIKSVGPQNARIRQEKNGGAWCPKAQISNEVREYLEIDLTRNHLITWTETQGRFGNGQGQEYAEAFIIEYWRSTLDQWVIYKDSRGEKVLTGNKNTYLVVKQRLELPFVASKVRFVPFSEHPRTVCMRVELYGCSWKQNIVQYTAPKGESRESQDPSTDLEDVSYDGVLDNGIMRNGLGQLVDGLYGDDDFQRQIHGESSGSRWVGWNNHSKSGNYFDILLEFDNLFEFSSVDIHTNNMFTRGVQIFKRAQVHFGLENGTFKQHVVDVTIPEDKTRESARNITILLHGNVAKYVRIRLYFSSQWILISEVSFKSFPVLSNFTENFLDKFYVGRDVEVSTFQSSSVGETTYVRKEVTPATSPSSNTQAYIGFITCVLTMILLLIGCIIFLTIRKGRKKVALLHKHTALVSSSTKPGVTFTMKDLKMNMSTPIINNALNRTGLSIKKAGNGHVDSKTVGNLYGHVNNAEESDSENSSAYHEPYKLLPSNNQEFGCLLKKDISSSKSDFTSVNSFQEEVKCQATDFANLGSQSHNIPRQSTSDLQNSETPIKTQKDNILSEKYYATTDLLKTERNEQHFTPGCFTTIKLPEVLPFENDIQLLEFPRHRLRMLERLGEGIFGTIHLCEAERLPDLNGGSVVHKKEVVIVKSLRRCCDESKKHEFLLETKWLSGLRDPNLACVVGICSQDEPVCTLIQHTDFGDIPRFLELRSSLNDDTNKILSHGCLIYLATQVASGMKYLEKLDIVHRDLAARNCVIDKNFTVRISDHAMYCDRYEKDYYMSDTKSRLPVRWMSWENLLLGKQTTKSDVWAFAVTLWEILMMCSETPYAELTNEQVIENCNHWYQNDGCQRYLPRPHSCPSELYDLMGECWKKESTERPRFSEIHLFLERKNLGYIPVNV